MAGEKRILKVSKFMADIDKRQVACDQVGDARISTVFLCIDHGHGSKKPVLFETMVFGGKHNDYTRRYRTWDEAVQGHKDVIDMILKA